MISLECLKEVCYILSMKIDPKETRQLVKEILERYGFSCNIDSLSVEKPSRRKEKDEDIVEDMIESEVVKETMTESEIAETLF